MADLIVVGCGLFGLTIAERAASMGLKVQILEKRNEIGGNAFTYFDQETNIEVHKYGSHLFHTNNENVWSYVTKFTNFNSYQHRVLTRHKDRHYSMPINLRTINDFYGLNLNPNEAQKFIESKINPDVRPFSNLEDKAISLVGMDLYNALIYGYTKKQWQVEPSELPPDVIQRLPFRFSYHENYFNDTHQGLPVDGYTKWFERMLDHTNISLALNTDFNNIKGSTFDGVPIVYTGPIDEYFNYCFGQLNWRTLDFETERKEIDDFQGAAVINYADLDFPFTRIHEYKHLHPERKSSGGTVISKEFSRLSLKGDEPFYPTNLKSDRVILSSYRELIGQEKNVFFGGRLGSYQYLDMHMAIAAALTLFDTEVKKIFARKMH